VTALAYANAVTPPPDGALAGITEAAVAKAGEAVATASAR
jgi:hypothetical protein